MSGLWIYRIHIIVPTADFAAANQMLYNAAPDWYGGAAFSEANLGTTDTPPPTHQIINSSATQGIYDATIAELAAWETYGLGAQPQYWGINVTDHRLLESNVSDATGNPTWGTTDDAQTIGAAGLVYTVWPEEQARG